MTVPASDSEVIEQVVLDLFIESSLAQTIAWVSSIIAVVLTMYEVWRHLQYYNLPLLQRQIVRVILMVPIYAIGSAWSLSMPQWSIYLATVRDIYEAYVIHCFLQVCSCYYGGFRAAPRSLWHAFSWEMGGI